MYNFFCKNINIVDFVNSCERELSNRFSYIEEIYQYNQLKVLKSFIENKVSESDFQESTGYGYADIGRDKIEKIFADIFGTEDALVRQQIVSGTHAISLSLLSILRPNDNLLSISGLPYDTILSTIGIHNEKGSLKDYNISFNYVDLINNKFDFENIDKSIKNNTKLILIQRSRGYTNRDALGIDEIKSVIDHIKNRYKNIYVMVDNCYGEFVNIKEPTDVGADLICGSLIKNIGGGKALSGGYIVGKKELIELCASRLTAPGIGKEVGISFNQNRNVLQGLYDAPKVVADALKISNLFIYTLNKLGIKTIPDTNTYNNDIVTAIILNDEKKLIKFCQIIQKYSPVDSYLNLVPIDMPGYDKKVIMAAGTFVSGSSIELSCDAPIKEPYIAYLQGGLNYYQGKLSLIKIIEELNLFNYDKTK